MVRIFLILLLLSTAGHGSSIAYALGPAPDNMRFERLLTGEDEEQRNGVGAIRDIVQDGIGYIWIAGESGLAKYDSHTFKFYYADPNNPRSLPSNWISDLQLDQDGVLWLATADGLSRYNRDTDDFTRFRSPDKQENSTGFSLASALAVDRQNNLIIGTGAGLTVLDAERQHFSHFRHDPLNSRGVAASAVVTLFIDSSERLWLGYAGSGISRMNRSTGTFQHWRHDPTDPASLADNGVQTIAEDRHGRIWVGTDRLGLSRMREDESGFQNYSHKSGDPRSIGSNVIRDIHCDSQGNLWIATDHGGLALYDENIDGFLHLRHHVYDRTTLNSDQLRDVFEDARGNLWVGAVPTGVNFYDINKARFKTLTHQPDNPNSLSHNGVLTIFQDSEDILWIGTEAGLDAYNPKTEQFVRYAPDPQDPTKLRFGAITSVTEDVDGSLWVGSWSGGLHKFDKKTQTFKNYYPVPEDPSSLIGPHIWKILRDAQNRIWIGATQQGGLSLYNRATDNFTHFKHDPANPASLTFDFVWSMVTDNSGQLWVGTLHGLDRFDPDTQTFSHFKRDPDDNTGITSNNVLAMIRDTQGMIWLGTEGGGLNLLDPATKKFRAFTVSDGLPSTHVASVVEDEQGNIWAGTANGLAKIDRKSFAITVLRKGDGLAGNTHHRSAALSSKDGRLFIGSTEGITVFDPETVDKREPPPKVVITGFRILNKEVTIGEPGSPLQKAIDQTDAITLRNSDIMFAFDFAALNFSSSGQTKYSYRLDGFDRDWNHVGTRRTATYTNLDPGKYTFRVKAETVTGVASEKDAVLEITIEPPLWRTWYAYVAYLLFALFILYLRRNYIALRAKSEQYQNMSTTDALTTLPNRTGLLQTVGKIWQHAADAEDICLLLLDVDHFKNVNDVWGHDVGDRILRGFAEVISSKVRAQDYVARWGGEEFILLCRHASSEAGVLIAEKLRQAIENHSFASEGHLLRITTSIGIAQRLADESFDSLFKRADVALYEAKAAGRNRVMLAASPAQNTGKGMDSPTKKSKQ